MIFKKYLLNYIIIQNRINRRGTLKNVPFYDFQIVLLKPKLRIDIM